MICDPLLTFDFLLPRFGGGGRGWAWAFAADFVLDPLLHLATCSFDLKVVNPCSFFLFFSFLLVSLSCFGF